MRKKLKWIIPLAVLVLIAGVFFIYVSIFYHADQTALDALDSDENVSVSRTDCGWFFDGPGDEDALIFYPGAKVEETAYAPLLKRLAGAGMDVYLVKMPFNLAFFGMNKAEKIMAQGGYENWYIGGHSLGGAMAAIFAADHGERLNGVILFAAYSTKTLKENLTVLSIYGSADGVLNTAKVAEGKAIVCGDYRELVIEGGNHAQFGSYGEQKGDGRASISAAEQWERTVDFIMNNK